MISSRRKCIIIVIIIVVVVLVVVVSHLRYRILSQLLTFHDFMRPLPCGLVSRLFCSLLFVRCLVAFLRASPCPVLCRLCAAAADTRADTERPMQPIGRCSTAPEPHLSRVFSRQTTGHTTRRAAGASVSRAADARWSAWVVACTARA